MLLTPTENIIRYTTETPKKRSNRFMAMVTAPHFHANQHLSCKRFLHKVAEITHVVL